MPAKRPDKGKGKASARTAEGETEPLLVAGGGPSSSSSTADYATLPAPASTHTTTPVIPYRPWPSKLLTILISTCTVLLSLTLFLLLLAYSYVPSRTESEHLSSAVTYSGPSRVDIINVTDSGIYVFVAGEIGIDTSLLLGIDREGIAREELVRQGWRGAGADWWESLRTWAGERALTFIGDVQVDLPSTIEVYTSADAKDPSAAPLLVATIPAPVSVNLTLPSNTASKKGMQAVSSVVHVEPLADPGKLIRVAQEAWVKGWTDVVVRVGVVEVGAGTGGSGGKGWFGWRTKAKVERRDLEVPLRFDVSRIPGLPPPGTNLTDLVHLESYSLQSRPNTDPSGPASLIISAVATVPNLLKEMRFDFPYRVGFDISLPVPPSDDDDEPEESADVGEEEPIGLLKMAEVSTAPIRLQGQDPIVVLIEGEIVGDLNAGRSADGGDTALSVFLRNYLHGIDNMITIRGSSSVTIDVGKRAKAGPPPTWLTGALPMLSLVAPFPAPDPAPKLIRSVTIVDMKISEASGKMRASGMIVAEIELPKDLAAVKVQVEGVMPDVLVYDGPAPEDGDDEVPEEPPYPPKAFGRIHPGYLNATSEESPDDPNVLIVKAPLKEVPLDILQGRDSVVSDFVSKVIFKGGALAGVKGVAAVEVEVRGVNGKVEVDGIPVNGEFVVGKPRFGLGSLVEMGEDA